MSKVERVASKLTSGKTSGSSRQRKISKNKIYDPMQPHKEEECPYLHVQNCPGCGRSCACHKGNPDHETRLDRRETKDRSEMVNHPSHYGGDTTYEAIKVINAWELNFDLGSVLKYICRAGKKYPEKLEDLKKAAWYLNDEIKKLEKEADADN